MDYIVLRQVNKGWIEDFRDTSIEVVEKWIATHKEKNGGNNYKILPMN